MDQQTKDSHYYRDLREKAEAILEPLFYQEIPGVPNIDETRRLMHELRTHQIELEIQNEELRKTQLELTETRDRYTDLYNFAPVGYLTVDAKGLIIEANLRAAELLGSARKALVNQPFSRFVSEDNQDIYYLHRNKLINTKEKQTCEVKLAGKDGVFEAILESVSEHTGETKFCRICITDISERKQLERKLEKSKKEWEESFDAISDLITIQNKDMTIMRANKAAHKFFQVGLGELVGQKCHVLFCGTTVPCPHCPQVQAQQDKQCHTSLINHEATGKIFQVSSSAILNENHVVQYFVHVAKDVTEQKKLEEVLLHTQRMEAIGTLANGISHDFNNILQAIMGYAELLRDKVSEDSGAKNYIDTLLEAANRARTLISQIYTFSHQKKTSLVKKPLEPRLILKEVIKMMRSTLPASVQITDHLDANSDVVLADASQLHQIVLNLFTNAIYAVKNGPGEISISLANKILTDQNDLLAQGLSPGLYVELTISDTGCGMTQKTISRIFEPYFTTKKVGDGSGLGLAVVHGIVKDLGGMIRVTSQKGRGTTFKVYLPSAGKLENDRILSEKKTPAIFPTGSERILVVDDESAIVDIAKRGLEELGYKVTGYTSSLEALEEFRSSPLDFDLIITDQSMPGMNGDVLIKEILKTKKDAQVIICTGDISRLPGSGGEDIGAKEVLLKPTELITIAQKVRKVLDQRKP